MNDIDENLKKLKKYLSGDGDTSEGSVSLLMDSRDTDTQEYKKDYDKDLLYIYKNNLFESIYLYIIDSYNFTIIDYLDEFKNEYIEFMYTTKLKDLDKNNILKRLYNNYMKNYNYTMDESRVLKSESFMTRLNILGPHYYKYYKHNNFNNLGPINIYLYGEYHNIFNKCNIQEREIGTIRFDDYIDIIMQNSSSFTDIYIESFFDDEYYKDYKRSEDELYMLQDLTNKYKHCLYTGNEGIVPDTCELFRFHYLDVRNRDTNQQYIKNEYECIYVKSDNIVSIGEFIELPINKEEIYTNEDYSNLTMYMMSYISIIKKIEEIINDKDKIFKFFKEDIYNKYVSKEVDRSYLKLYIYNFIDTSIKFYIESNYNMLVSHIDKINELSIDYDSNIEELIDDITYFNRKYLTPLYAYQMDCYALSRIFKKFKIGSDYPGISQVYKPTVPRNIIIYTGSNHIKRYCDFLSINDFTLIDEDIRNRYTEDSLSYLPSCINIKIKDLYFSKLFKKYFSS